MLRHSRLITGRGFMGVDGETELNDERIEAYVRQLCQRRACTTPNSIPTCRIRSSFTTPRKPQPETGNDCDGWKYTYAELDDFTDLIGRTLLGAPQTSRVERKGVLPQAVYLDYSQERLASYGLQPADLSRILNARNITLPGGSVEAGGRRIQIDPSGKFEAASDVGDVL